MVRLLEKSSLQETDLSRPEIQKLHCGSAPWELDVTTWIKSPSGERSALQDMAQPGYKVWLYWTEEGELVGFGSLWETTWRLPTLRGARYCLNYIPYIGVARQFHGEPKEAVRADRFAYQIIDHLIECAVDNTNARVHLYSYIGALVEAENARALQFCANVGFANVQAPTANPESRRGFERLVLNISNLVDTPRQILPGAKR